MSERNKENHLMGETVIEIPKTWLGIPRILYGLFPLILTAIGTVWFFIVLGQVSIFDFEEFVIPLALFGIGLGVMADRAEERRRRDRKKRKREKRSL